MEDLGKIGVKNVGFAFLMLVNSALVYLLIDGIYSVIQTQLSRVGVANLLIIVSFFIATVLLNFDAIKLGLKKNRAFLAHIVFVLASITVMYLSINYPLNPEFIYSLIMAIVFVSYVVFLKKQVQKLNLKLSYFILGVLALSNLGLIITSDITGQKGVPLELTLNKCKPTSEQLGDYRFSCGDLEDRLIVGRNVTCILKNNPSSNISGYFNFTYSENDTIYTSNFSDTIWFKVPESLKYFYVEVNFTDHNGNKVCGSWGNLMTFPNYNDYVQSNKDFIAYLTAFYAFLLLSIPTLYKQYHELYEDLRK